MQRTHHVWTLVFAICSAVLLYALFRPTSPQELFANSDKVGHVLIFFTVAMTGRLSAIALPEWVYWPIWAGLSIGLEYLQGALLPLRIFSFEDAWANLTGIVLAAAVWLVMAICLKRARDERARVRCD